MLNAGVINSPSRNLVFLSWQRGIDTGQVDCFYINFFKGHENNNPLLEKIKSYGLKYHVQYIHVHQLMNKFHFTNKKPPTQYTCAQVKSEISSLISSELMEASVKTVIKTVSLDDFCEHFKKNKGNSFVQPKKRWIQEAINFFHKNMKWVEVPKDSNEPLNVIVKPFKTRRRKINDEYTFFSKEWAKIRLREKKQAKKKEEKLKKKVDPKQKSLSEF